MSELTSQALKQEIETIVSEIGKSPGDVIPILHAVQERFNYLPEEALRYVCEITAITPAAIAGISTFYPQFRKSPVGKHIIHVCTGTACHVKGAELVEEALRRHLHISENQDTDAQKLFTVQKVACLGCCTLAPVVQVGDVVYGKVRPDRVAGMLEDFLAGAGSRSDHSRTIPVQEQVESEIRIGLGSCCVAGGSSKVHRALEKYVIQSGAAARVKRVGCVGMCHRTPLLELSLPGKEPLLYDKVQAQHVKRILHRHIKPKRLRTRLRNTALNMIENVLDGRPGIEETRCPIEMSDPDIAAFTRRQQRIASEHCGRMDPLDIQEYRRRDGFKALETCLKEFSPQEIIDKIKQSGLRGRGGAGFPTWQKLQETGQAQGDKKYIICNGDEGDPGAFMDRMILESYPFRVIEGMIIFAYTVGAHEGYFYIRHEYPLARQRVQAALETCRERHILGENIAASGFSLNLQIAAGAGAFVCGEETALIASLEGKRGMPRFRPPYPAQQGLYGRPTLVNNCETLAQVPWIIRNGAAAYAALGTEQSKGTKVFSLAGKVVRGGLIEVPMGVTLSEIVYEIGGGIENGRRFKAVQVGGPSGGCIPAAMADTPVDYEALTQAGAMMGSGGLLVMDETDCMVDIARYFLAFTCAQSCGKCTFCRIGTRMMLDTLERLCSGTGASKDLERLEEIAAKTKQGSLCGLGKTAPNPVLTTLRYFREEYEAHLQGRCPAKRCKALITYSIDAEKCIGCTLCAQSCPGKAIPTAPYQKHEITQEKCIKCGTCRSICPTDAVIVNSPPEYAFGDQKPFREKVSGLPKAFV